MALLAKVEESEDLVAHVTLLELYEEASEEDCCVVAPVVLAAVVLFFTFLTYTAARTFTASLIFLSYS